ncbi:hypothetical protein DQ184_13010 [Enterococcus faecium]|uniref:hypothetical protein n=1 Tax=Enterococcus faecium TaxID=1352 RepID=UPI000CF04317|nr:hypothetical protein [Enterococcus faecium]EGP4917781.1 hypothetical protein [Enterococcus faecium]EGP5747266.1 hypothetical protein [Enterococcus faecium]EME3506683.1 hypothetical protein [Enterococcus faecium]EMF0334095.1 hypothetical protein [Enterococcus faecium]EMF0419076.1 hypothetical protein [Enterococcus faecium]
MVNKERDYRFEDMITFYEELSYLEDSLGMAKGVIDARETYEYNTIKSMELPIMELISLKEESAKLD